MIEAINRRNCGSTCGSAWEKCMGKCTEKIGASAPGKRSKIRALALAGAVMESGQHGRFISRRHAFGDEGKVVRVLHQHVALRVERIWNPIRIRRNHRETLGCR